MSPSRLPACNAEVAWRQRGGVRRAPALPDLGHLRLAYPLHNEPSENPSPTEISNMPPPITRSTVRPTTLSPAQPTKAALDVARAKTGTEGGIGHYAEMPWTRNGQETRVRVSTQGSPTLYKLDKQPGFTPSWKLVTPEEAKALRVDAVKVKVPDAGPTPQDQRRLTAAAPANREAILRQIRAQTDRSEAVDAFRTRVLEATAPAAPNLSTGWIR
jgi:hypothetical protein